MKRVLIIGILFLITFSVSGCGQENEDPLLVEKYNEAMEILEKETISDAEEFYKFEDARKIFEELGDFRDSEEKANQAYLNSIPSAIAIADNYINDGDIWGAQNILNLKFGDNMPSEISEYLEDTIFSLLYDWKFESQGTSLRIDLSNQLGHFDVVAVEGSDYNTGTWKIKNNALYFCPILDDDEIDSNYVELFKIISHNSNSLTIENNSGNQFILERQ